MADKEVVANMLRVVPLERPTPALLANAGAISVSGENVVISFAAGDALRPPTVQGDQSIIDCAVFAQIAMSRSQFGSFLVHVVKSMKGFQERESLGWSDMVKELADEAPAKS